MTWFDRGRVPFVGCSASGFHNAKTSGPDFSATFLYFTANVVKSKAVILQRSPVKLLPEEGGNVAVEGVSESV